MLIWVGIGVLAIVGITLGIVRALQEWSDEDVDIATDHEHRTAQEPGMDLARVESMYYEARRINR